MIRLRSVSSFASVAIFALLVSGCRSGSGAAPGGQPGGAPGPMPVEMVTLAPKPIEQTTEFVGTIKSRRSTTIQPQVEGFITRIAVKSGDRVGAGALLMEIDARPQEAVIASLESVKAQREIDVTYARQEADRARKLLEAGASSQMDADRAANALNAAQAQVRTVEEQIRQARTDLAYYRVTSPTAGVVADVPVRQGDRVTKATMLTTVEANEGLELYLNVPIQQAPQLKIGLPVRLVDDAGRDVARSAISFISPSADPEMQTVLAKVPIEASSGFRTSQFVRAQVIWTTTPTLSVPVTAVLRINGQYFAFVAEGGVAHQRPVTLGTVLGNDYIVLDGLKAGETLIVSGVQKIGEGAPVTAAGSAAAPPGAPGTPAPARGARSGAPAPPGEAASPGETK